jgi:transcriptional regulator with GAF, ATPase, and Fis domain
VDHGQPTSGSARSEYAGRMAELARDLRSQTTSGPTLDHVVRATAELVKGCADVAVTLADADGVHTRASLGVGIAERSDRLQAQYGEGPVVDAAWDSPLVVAGDLPHDAPWPRWGSALAEELGVRSVLVVQLFTHEEHELGALQLFATSPHAFDGDAVGEVMGIAGQAAVALAAVANLEDLERSLTRRTAVGQATGILMERYGLDQHAAFEVLRRTSQESGRMVHELAQELTGGRRPEGL